MADEQTMMAVRSYSDSRALREQRKAIHTVPAHLARVISFSAKYE